MAWSNPTVNDITSISTTELFSDTVTFLEKDFSTVTVTPSSNTQDMTVTLYTSSDTTDPPAAGTWAVHDTFLIEASQTEPRLIGSVPNIGIRHMRIGAAASAAMTATLAVDIAKGSFA